MRTSLTHSDGWKWTPPPKLIQRLRAEDFLPDEFDRDQRDEADAVGPGGEVEQAMVVDERDEEHEDEADGEEADLLLVEAVELGHGGGGTDLEDADDGEQGDHAEQGPVEVAVGGEALHEAVASLLGG